MGVLDDPRAVQIVLDPNVSIRQARGMRPFTSHTSTKRPSCTITTRALCRQFATKINFNDGIQTVYTSMAKLDVIMQTLHPGQHVIVENANGCKWELACQSSNVFSLLCTKNAEEGVSCLIHGGVMNVVCKELHPNTLEMLLYANNQILPCFNVCQNVATCMKENSRYENSVDAGLKSSPGRFAAIRMDIPRIFAENN